MADILKCHCEECNDEAIPLVIRLPRPDTSGLAITFAVGVEFIRPGLFW